MDYFKIAKYYRPITESKYGLLLYRNDALYLYKDNVIRFFSNIKINGFRGRLSKTRFLTRIFHRYVFCGITPKDKDYSFISFNDAVYYVDYKNRRVEKSLEFSCPGMHRPLSFYEVKDIPGFVDCIVFGDYSYNKDRNEIALFRYANSCWEKVFVFQSGCVRHIHSVIPDPFNKRVLILTGDKDSESAIWSASDNFEKVEQLFGGSQKYRACCGKAFENGVILATDSPFDQNKLFLLTEKGGIHIEDICNLPGPTVFFTDYKDNLIFATDVENDEKTLSPISEFLINKKGDGVLDNYSHVFLYRNDKQEVKEIAKFEKDCLPMRLFGFGTVHFPDHCLHGRLYFYPMAVKKHDQTLLYIDLEGDCENSKCCR